MSVTAAAAAAAFRKGKLAFGDANHLTPFSIGAALMLAAANIGVEVPPCIATLRHSQEDSDAANKIALEACAILDPAFVEAETDTEHGRKQILAGLIATLSVGAAIQARTNFNWARSRLMLGLSPRLPMDEKRQELLHNACSSRFGADLRTVNRVLAIVAIMARSSAQFSAHTLFSNSPRPASLIAILTRLAPAISCPHEEVANRALGEFAPCAALDSKTLAFFQQYPLIQVGAEHFIAGPWPLVQGAIGLGLLMDVMEGARVAEGRPDTHVSVVLGERFEAYIGLLLRELSNTHEIYAEHKFIRGSEDDSADHVVVDKGSKGVVTVINDKLARLSPGAFFGADPNALESDVNNKLVRPLVQSIAYLHRLLNAHDQGALRPEAVAVAASVREAKRLVVLGVFPGMTPLFHFDYFRNEVVEPSLAAALKDLERRKPKHAGVAEFYTELRTAQRVTWHLMDVRELEAFVCAKPRRRLGKVITQFLGECAGKPVGRGDQILGGFEHWVRENLRWPGSSDPDFVSEEMHAHMRDVGAYALDAPLDRDYGSASRPRLD